MLPFSPTIFYRKGGEFKLLILDVMLSHISFQQKKSIELSEMQTQVPSVRGDGSQLSHDDRYHRFLEDYSKLNPNLGTLDIQNKWAPLPSRTAEVTMLEINQGTSVVRRNFSSGTELRDHLHTDAPVGGETGRIYIVQNLASDFVEVLNLHFPIDPRFFADQARNTSYGLPNLGSLQTPYLPSLMNKEMFLMKYFELRHFLDPRVIKKFNMWCAQTCRHISTCRCARPDIQPYYDIEPIGIIHRRCSFWSKRYDNGSWVALILCDPPTKDVFVKEKGQNLEGCLGIEDPSSLSSSPSSSKFPEKEKIDTKPYAGGYLDFIKHPNFGLNVPEGPPRTSMLEDICFYWSKHRTKFERDPGPATAAKILEKLVASNYMQLINFVNAHIGNLGCRLSRRFNANLQSRWSEEQWSDIQTWTRRCPEYIKDVEDIMTRLGIPFPTYSNPQGIASDWTTCHEDFQYIHHHLNNLKSRAEGLSNSMTGIGGVAETERSIKQGASITILTKVGLVFIPLAFCAGIFSMNEQYLPGGASFGVYLAVSVSLIIVVFLAAFLIGLGYGDDGKWRFKTLHRSISVFRATVSGRNSKGAEDLERVESKEPGGVRW